jgi:hypothetical protein
MIMDAGRVAKNHLAVVFVVVSCGLAVAAVQAGELHQAASRGDLAAVDALLLAGSVDLDKSDAIGTPLHHAIMGQYYRVARRLIAAGANLNVVDVTLGTPLYLAVREGDEAATRLLITAGADLEAQGALGTPLHLAAQHDLVQPSEKDGLISAQAESGFAVMVHRKGFAMVSLK